MIRQVWILQVLIKILCTKWPLVLWRMPTKISGDSDLSQTIPHLLLEDLGQEALDQEDLVQEALVPTPSKEHLDLMELSIAQMV